MARSAATLAGDGLTYVVPRRLEISPALLAKWFIYMGGKVNASITGRDCRGRSRVLSSGFIIRIRRIRWLFRPASVKARGDIIDAMRRAMCPRGMRVRLSAPPIETY